MARAEAIPTTRRSFVRLAASAAAAATIPPVLTADTALIQLAHELQRITRQMNATEDHDSVQELYLEGAGIFDEIFEHRATTLPGVQAKCRALCWLHGPQREFWDSAYSYDLIQDVLAIQTVGA